MEGPLQKLVYAMMLSSIKKGARVIRIVSADPMRVFFDFGDTCIEEMRPPARLRNAMFDVLCAMSGASEYSPGHITLLVGGQQHEWAARWRGNTFRLKRIGRSRPS
jgi:hypothetical protein